MTPLEQVAEATHLAWTAKRERDDAIAAAHAVGASLRQIAKVACLSHQRVAQIIDEAKSAS
jgi:lambda repressor-like predicted transcriptional regulator